MASLRRILCLTLALLVLTGARTSPLAGAQEPLPATWTHTTQADWMAGSRDHLDVRGLDALGTPFGLDRDPRGAIRLRSQPGAWDKHPASPVIVPGAEGAWDDAVISEAKVVYDGAQFHMWYAGRKRGPPGLKMPMDIGYAISQDGLRWTKPQPGAVLVRGPLGGYDENMITAPAVLYDGERFHMWYGAVDFGGDWSINYATSTDGVRWLKSDANPLLVETHDARWDADYVSEPSVLYNGTGFEMWYNGASVADDTKETVIGHATSPDGVDWTRSSADRPAFDVGADGAWDDYAVARAHVLYDGEQYKLWYEGHSGGTWRIGYATSTDGIEWARDPRNPIVDLGPEGAWDSQVASEPFVLYDGQTYRLYHSGYDGDQYRVGMVTAPAVYAPQGVYVSAPISSETPIEWGTLTVDAAVHAPTALRVQVATSHDGETWDPWTLAASDLISGVNHIDLTSLGLPQTRYLRYQIVLSTADPAVSPLVREVMIAEATPDFAVAISPPALSLFPGERGIISVSLSALRGYAGPVTLEIDSPAPDLDTAWPANPVIPPASIQVTVGVRAGAQAGEIPVQISARGGELVHHASLTVSVAAPAATPTAAPTPTSVPTPTPPISPPPPAPTDAAPLRLGVGLIAGSIGVALVWTVALIALRPRKGATRRARWWRHWGWAILLLAALGAGLYQSWQYVLQRRAAWEAVQSGIPRGVFAAGIDAGGLTVDDLRAAVEARAAAATEREIVVRYGDRTTSLATAELGIQTNAAEIVSQAAALRAAQPTPTLRDLLTGDPPRVDVRLPLTYTFDLTRLDPWVEALAHEVETPPSEHAWDPDTLIFAQGKAGIALDAEGARAALQSAVLDPAVGAVELPLTPLAPAPWDEDEIAARVAPAAAQWSEPPLPASVQPVTIPFDYERWIGPGTPAADWEPTRPMTGYAFLPGRMGWALDVAAVEEQLAQAIAAGAPVAGTRAFVPLAPEPLTLADIEPALLEIAAHFDGFTGLYVQDLQSGSEIRHNTYVTTSGMSMLKVAIMVTAYRTLPRPFSAELQDAIAQMTAHSINEKSNDVILQIGQGDFATGLERVNETLQALDMRQTYIASGYRVEGGPSHERIPVPDRPAAEVPPEERVDLYPDPSMQTSLADQVLLFQALYHGAQGEGALLAAFPALSAQDCQEMFDLLKGNPTRTLLGPGFGDDVPLAHKNGFGGGAATDERMDVGIVWPPDGRPYLVGLYQWDDQPWIHWLRVWPQQIELSATLYGYFTMAPPGPAPAMPE
ncbi:MAG: serine hydrolase [Anaerolineae bacterium]|nr:serine hydrolase [Anaerolineae bacterium]